MKPLPPYNIFPLGDTGLVIDFGNVIDESLNKIVHSLFKQFREEPFAGMTEVVPGYSSLTVYYDVLSLQLRHSEKTAFELVNEKVREKLTGFRFETQQSEDIVKVPVCYDMIYGPDLDVIAERNNISVEEIIQQHISTSYRIYMLGFLPGFAYMGEVNEKIACARKPQPVVVEAGSVGIAGKQTGIYPLRSPGGWQIIGRTPLKLFDKSKDDPAFFRAGSRVQFYAITSDEFIRLQNS